MKFKTITKKFKVAQFDGSQESAENLRPLLIAAAGLVDEDETVIEVSKLENGLVCIEFYDKDNGWIRIDNTDWIVKNGAKVEVWSDSDFKEEFL